MEINQQTRDGGAPIGHRFEFFILLLTVFLLPIIRIPHESIFVVADKSLFVILGAALALLVWLASRLSTGSLVFPRSGILYSLAVVWFAQFLATLFSLQRGVSLSGSLFDPDSLVFFAAMLVIVFLSSIASQVLPRVAMFYLALFASASVLFLAQFVHLISGSNFGGFFLGSSSSLAGGIYDFGLIMGLALLLALVFIEFSPSKNFFKQFGYVVLVFAAISLVLVNASLLWWFVGLGSLLITGLCYRTRRGASISTGLGDEKRSRFATTPIIVIALSILCLVSGRPEGQIARLSGRLMPYSIEARPSWKGTYGVGIQSLKENPVFGVGPGLFAREWVKYKDVSVNLSDYWSADFLSGVGYVPSKIVSSGLLGILTWLFFLVVLMRHAISTFRHFSVGSVDNPYHIAGAVGLVYLWVLAIVDVPNPALLALTAAFTGLFVGSLVQKGSVSQIVVSSSIYPRMKSLLTFILVLLALGSFSVAYGSLADYRAIRAYSASLAYTQSGDLEHAAQYAKRAIALDDRDVYHRHASDVYLLSLVRSSSALDPKSPEAAQIFVQLYGLAVSEAQAAVAGDESSYLNHLKLGGVYESVVNLGIEGAYEQAKSSYLTAMLLNPTSPVPPYLLARLEVLNKNIPGAVDYLNRAVELKPNYSPAYMLASQVALEDGDLATAIKTTELGVLSDPGDFSSFFQLGYLRYQNKDYQLAAEALAQAVVLNPAYANAHYFLGLSLAKMGKFEEAILELENVLVSNPDSKEVSQVLEQLRRGSANFGRD